MPEVRLIDANALLKKCIEGDGDNKFTEGYNFAVQEISAYIALSPTIEPEVRHGRWKGWTTSKFTGKYKDYDEPEFKDYVYYTCSECYRKSAIQELYCPYCGARMDATDTNVGGKGGADNG